MRSFNIKKKEYINGSRSLKRRDQTGKTRSLPLMRYAAAAAILIFLVAASLWFFTPVTSQFQAANKNARTVTLNEGSQIQLNDGSSLTFKRFRYSDQRVTQLEGEALFSVSSGSPFSVETDKGVVRVLGTIFNVRTWGSKLLVQ